MAGTCSYAKLPLFSVLSTRRSRRGIQCCSASSSNNKNRNPPDQSPLFLRITVSAVTELLRIFSPPTKIKSNEIDEGCSEILVSSVDDILLIIKSDYEKAYFVTGDFTSAVYADDCTFEDPTISFRVQLLLKSRNDPLLRKFDFYRDKNEFVDSNVSAIHAAMCTELYSRNLKLLVPFFEEPSINLKNIEKGSSSGKEFITASWNLRTYLKLPWRPLISVDGRTVYNLDEKLKIVKHVESWNISALEAVGQIFTSGFRS